VAVLDAARGYDLVETADRYRGWIRSAALRSILPRSAPYPRPDRAWRVVNFMCQIYREKDVTSASPIATAPLLATVELVEDPQQREAVLAPRDGAEDAITLCDVVWADCPHDHDMRFPHLRHNAILSSIRFWSRAQEADGW